MEKNKTSDKVEKTSFKKEKKEPFYFKWGNNEFKFILIAFVLFVLKLWYKFWEVNQSARVKHEISGLCEGWFGYPRDCSDPQWISWSGNFPILLVASVIFLSLSNLIKKTYDPYLNHKPIIKFYIAFGIGFLIYTMRTGIIYWFLLTLANYLIAKACYKWKFYPILLWTLSLITLYFNETRAGYGFTWISPSLAFMDDQMYNAPAKWFTFYNLSLLRILSFCLDLRWARENKGIKVVKSEKITYRDRVDQPHPVKEYSLENYYAYLMYVPLFFTGPIISFNAFFSQVQYPQITVPKKGVINYGIRFVVCFIGINLYLQLYYSNAISDREDNIKVWREFDLESLLMLALSQLIFIWYKFLIIWRFARLWALVDGIETVENMNRCACNNYTFEGFWRSWHRSYNQWLIRYMFIPLGGSKYKLYNTFVIFTFVAIWHDLKLDLLIWAWMISLVLIPEVLAKSYFVNEKRRHLWNNTWLRYLGAFGGSMIIVFLVSCNLIGFGTGAQRLLYLLDRLKTVEGISTIFFTVILLNLAVNVMFKIRENEEKEGKGNNY